ncbi:MAG: hypothetical protein GXZ11_02935 [Tissierellia bacterium]|nr:hypothetical protein [Tissierellia bacterium]
MKMTKVNELKLAKKEEITIIWKMGQVGKKIGKEIDLYFSELSFMNLSKNNICGIYRDPQNRFQPTTTEDLPTNSFLETYVEVTAGDEAGKFRLGSISYISYYDAKRQRVFRVAEKRFMDDRNEYLLAELEDKVEAAVEKTTVELFSDYNL